MIPAYEILQHALRSIARDPVTEAHEAQRIARTALKHAERRASLEAKSFAELRNNAKRFGFHGWHRMNRLALINLLDKELS